MPRTKLPGALALAFLLISGCGSDAPSASFDSSTSPDSTASPYCSSSMALGEALCRAGGASSCSSSMSVAEAVCLAGAGLCYSPSKGICYQRMLLAIGVI